MIKINIIDEKDYFEYIKIPELPMYEKHLYKNFYWNIFAANKTLFINILDEIELFKIKKNKFYETPNDLNNDNELTVAKLEIYDFINDIEREVEIVKKLGFDNNVEGVYEIRLDSDTYIYRAILFPYSIKNSILETPFVTFTYAFDKKHLTRQESNKLTDDLRDSSNNIKLSFKDEETIKNYLKIKDDFIGDD